MKNQHHAEDLDLGRDLVFTAQSRRAAGSGIWVCGKVHGHRFEALVFSRANACCTSAAQSPWA